MVVAWQGQGQARACGDGPHQVPSARDLRPFGASR